MYIYIFIKYRHQPLPPTHTQPNPISTAAGAQPARHHARGRAGGAAGGERGRRGQHWLRGRCAYVLVWGLWFVCGSGTDTPYPSPHPSKLKTPSHPDLCFYLHPNPTHLLFTPTISIDSSSHPLFTPTLYTYTYCSLPAGTPSPTSWPAGS